jgi:N-acetylmuramoyl-L-alanine amidase CwlA
LILGISALMLLIIIIIYAVFFISKFFNKPAAGYSSTETISSSYLNGLSIKADYLTPNEYSRPQTRLKKVNAIVIHYTANPGTSAKNNRSYFDGLARSHATKASSHFIIGLKGEILQCIPLNEISYASNNRNSDTISIECCHPDESGKFNDKTYASLIALAARLCAEYDLTEKDIIRHYDVTGKECPLYYVKHEDAWEQMKTDIMAEADKLKGELAEKK